MAHKSTIFKKVCRIITSLIGIGDSIFLIFTYSDKYWLTFFGYRNLAVSLFFFIFSLGAFISAILVLMVSKKHFKHLGYYFSFFFAVDFFFAIFILYFSWFKAKEETYYWIVKYNDSHQNQQIIVDFNKDYPPNKIDSYIRKHAIIVHDVILLTIFIWLIFFILYTFYSRKIMKYLIGKKSNSKRETNLDQNNSELIHDIETEYEYEYSYSSAGNNKPNNKDRMKISHVKSADKILHLDNNIDDDIPETPKPKSSLSDNKSSDNDSNKDSSENKENDTQNNHTPSSLTSSLIQPTIKESDKSSKSTIKRKKKRSPKRNTEPIQDNNKGSFKEDLSESVIVSISPVNKKKKYDIPKLNWDPRRVPRIELSDDGQPHKKYPKVRYSWDKPINVYLSSDSYSSELLANGSNLYSSVILYDSYDSVSFGFDYSDSW